MSFLRMQESIKQYMEAISWSDFEKIELRTGTIVDIQDFPEARNPAYKIWVDFGNFGIKKTSAQITRLYTKEELLGQQILGVINFPPKQVGPFISEFLLTGFDTQEGIVITTAERRVQNGLKLI